MSNMTWLHLEQATIWIRKSIQDTTDNIPCAHCLNEARLHLDLAQGIKHPEEVA